MLMGTVHIRREYRHIYNFLFIQTLRYLNGLNLVAIGNESYSLKINATKRDCLNSE